MGNKNKIKKERSRVSIHLWIVRFSSRHLDRLSLPVRVEFVGFAVSRLTGGDSVAVGTAQSGRLPSARSWLSRAGTTRYSTASSSLFHTVNAVRTCTESRARLSVHSYSRRASSAVSPLPVADIILRAVCLTLSRPYTRFMILSQSCICPLESRSQLMRFLYSCFSHYFIYLFIFPPTLIHISSPRDRCTVSECISPVHSHSFGIRTARAECAARSWPYMTGPEAARYSAK